MAEDAVCVDERDARVARLYYDLTFTICSKKSWRSAGFPHWSRTASGRARERDEVPFAH